MKNKKILKKDFWKNLISKIKKEKINQVPKYIFIFKNVLIWFFLFFSIITGALSLSISFEYLVSADWYLINRLWIIKIVTIFMPFFWILFLILASVLSYYNFKNTQRWYKFSLIKILWINITVSILLWIFLYFSWFNPFIEWKMENYIPKYRSLLVEDKISRMIWVWQNEDLWLLIWKINTIENNILKITDYNNKSWEIKLSNITKIKWRVNLDTWEKIKIIWEKLNDNIFKAEEIRPFTGRIK